MPCDVASNMEKLFGRYWDSAQRAQTYDVEVGGTNIFGVHNHISELKALLHYVDPGNVGFILDAGCGNGRFLAELPPGTPSVGLDASLNLLRITRRKGRGQFHVCAELEHLPFRTAQFDTVISCRVLQHLKAQREGVLEICRVIRQGGGVVLELYNEWNPKTIYKNIRMSPYRKMFNFPFRLLFKSMSPFGDWGLAYDQYNGWFQTKGWLREGGMDGFSGRGVGFGYHKYLFEPFYINAILEKRYPDLLGRYYDICLSVETWIGPVIPFRYTLEKFVMHATKQRSAAMSADRPARGRIA